MSNKNTKHSKIKKQLYSVYFIAILIPIIIISSYLIVYTRSLILKHYYAQINSDNIRVRSIVLDATTSIISIADDIFTDKSLQSILSATYQTRVESDLSLSSYTRLRTYLDQHTEISSIAVYTTNPTIHDYSFIRSVTEEIKAEDWYIRASTQPEYLWSTQMVKDKGGTVNQELSFSYRIPIIETGEYAILKINISNNFLKSHIHTNSLLTEITVNSDPICYSSSGNIGKQPDCYIDYDRTYYSFSGAIPYNGTKSLVEISTLVPVRSHDKIYFITIDNKAVSETNRILLICFLLIIMSFVIPLFVVISFTGRFTTRVFTLRHEMHKVSGGDYNIIDDFRGDDELGELFNDLKLMIESIKEMDKQIYQEKITKQKLLTHQQKMEFDMLASQINPHFLYNSLETIRMKALSTGDKEVATAVKLLGKYMRHNLESSGNSATLKSELEYIEIYLMIQKLRFGDKINYTFTMSDEIDSESYNILPLLIQPVVENAILHGLEEIEENGQIHISITKENALLIINVQDNGMGMNEETLQILMTRIRTQGKHLTSSIGLNNIYQRIQLFYGPEYGMEIISTPGQGTIVKIILPLYFTWEE